MPHNGETGKACYRILAKINEYLYEQPFETRL